MHSSMRKKLSVCVRPGVELVRAKPRELVRALSKLDLPMFERPQNAISGRRSWGKSSGCFALLTNRAELILTTHSARKADLRFNVFHYSKGTASVAKVFNASPNLAVRSDRQLLRV